ncbi:MAG: cation diffusion facilitator family transporter [Actinomycetia bacterium]|nr:cation diffusion facilitator family transporter [Actinomycetes bacterium]
MHEHNHKSSATTNIKVAFFLNLGFAIVEVIGGFWTNSLAIASDALHDLGDSLSLGLSWILEKYSNRKNDSKYTYGYKRYSLLAALINAIILTAGSLFILYQAVNRILEPQPVHAQGMIYFAIGGIIVNGLAVLRLRKGKTLNEKIVSFHLLEDVLGWIAVLVISIVMMFKDIPILDPILSSAIAVYILYNVAKNLKKTLSVFMQAAPEGINIEDIDKNIMQLDKVIDVHHTHLWSIDSLNHVLTTHIVVEDQLDLQQISDIKRQIKEMLKPLGLEHVTLEMERKSETCNLRDQDCF